LLTLFVHGVTIVMYPIGTQAQLVYIKHSSIYYSYDYVLISFWYL